MRIFAGCAARLRAHSALAGLLLLIILVYAHSLFGDFVVDDVPVIRDNPYIQQSGHWGDYFSSSLWANSALEDRSVPMYRPLFHVFHALSFSLWGAHPFGYHAVLLLLHLANTCLVYLLLRRLLPLSSIAATFGAAVFALNPARVESVAWISGVTDPLTTLFLLLAMLAHRALSTRGNRPWLWAAALACFQCALWNKEVALVFPLVAVAHDLIYTRRVRWGISALYALLAAGYLLTRSVVLGHTGDWSALAWPQVSRMTDFLLGYSELLTFPGRVPFFLAPPTHAVGSIWGVAGALALLLLAALAWRGSDAAGRRGVLFALCWGTAFFWSALLMMFYQAGYYSARFLYLPSVGVALLAALLYQQLAAKHRPAVVAGALLLVTGYSVASWLETADWQDDGHMYAKIVHDAPDKATGYVGLGHYYFTHDDYGRAEQAFQTALQRQGSRLDRAAALASLGTIRGMAGDVAQSRRYLEQAVALDPANSEAWTGLGNLAWMDGQLRDAIPAYEKALAIRPGNYEAAMNLASAYEKTGQPWRADTIRQRLVSSRH